MNGWAVRIMARLSFRTSETGTILITIAVIIPIILIIVGFIVDIGRALAVKENLNQACMVAASETAKCLNITTAMNDGRSTLCDEYQETAMQYLYANFQNNESLQLNNINLEIVDNNNEPKFIKVLCELEMNCYFLPIMGINNINIHSSANGRLKRIK